MLSMVTHASLALAAYAVSVPAVAMRWRAVLRGVTGRRLPLGKLVLASLASSFVNNVTAGPGGEACRIVALVRLKFASASRATAAVVYERLSEVPAFALMVLACVVAFARGPWQQLGRIARPTLVIGFALCAALWIVRGPLVRQWRRLHDRHDRDPIVIAPRTFAISTAWSFAIWTLDITRLWLIARVFDAAISVPQAAALSAIAIVGGLAPTVGGLGVIEGGLIAGLLAFGVPSPTAIAITAAERSISYGLATAAGAGALALLGGRELWSAMRATPRTL